MSPNAWECPRCKRINAPTTGFCMCQPSANSGGFGTSGGIWPPAPTSPTLPIVWPNKAGSSVAGRCLSCNEYHGLNIPCPCTKVTS